MLTPWPYVTNDFLLCPTGCQGKVDYNRDASGAPGIRHEQFRKHTGRYSGPVTSLSVIPAGVETALRIRVLLRPISLETTINLIVVETWRVMKMHGK